MVTNVPPAPRDHAWARVGKFFKRDECAQPCYGSDGVKGVCGYRKI